MVNAKQHFEQNVHIFAIRIKQCDQNRINKQTDFQNSFTHKFPQKLSM